MGNAGPPHLQPLLQVALPLRCCLPASKGGSQQPSSMLAPVTLQPGPLDSCLAGCCTPRRKAILQALPRKAAPRRGHQLSLCRSERSRSAPAAKSLPHIVLLRSPRHLAQLQLKLTPARHCLCQGSKHAALQLPRGPLRRQAVLLASNGGASSVVTQGCECGRNPAGRVQARHKG